MRYLIVIILSVSIFGCISIEGKHNEMVSDPSYGVILVKADNQNAALSAQIQVENINTGEKVVLRDMIREGNRGNPVVFKLTPGLYRLSRYKLYTNLRPSLKHINYFFSVEAQQINYVGDWTFKEFWQNGDLDVDFSVEYHPETVNKAKDTFKIILNKWPLAPH
ncbi:hypothetical protein [Kangiella sp.]|uniref:hypothetical protein n=1 Tax=Kangiella sp. TaxID=1920245 RepID=UPI003A8FA93D